MRGSGSRSLLVSLAFLACCVIAVPSAGQAADREIRGSIFLSTFGGAVNFRLSLARVYVLSQRQAFDMYSTNQAQMQKWLAHAQHEHTERQNTAITDHNNRVLSLNTRKTACEAEVDRLEKRIAEVESSQAAGAAEELSKLHRERIKAVNDYGVMEQEAIALAAKKPVIQKWEFPKDRALDVMLQPPEGIEYQTRSDSDGAFAIKVDEKQPSYILILPREPSVRLRWFLRLDRMKKDGEKYLFTDENVVGRHDKAQALEFQETVGKIGFRIN